MVTTVGKGMDLSHVVKDLIVLEHDAMAAYKAAIERLEKPAYKTQIASFLTDHERHLSELLNYLEGMGINAPEGPDLKVVLTKGKVVLADLFGDKAILMAMKTNEDDTVTAYERASQHTNLPEGLGQHLSRAHQDELRHRAWIVQTLEAEDSEKAA